MADLHFEWCKGSCKLQHYSLDNEGLCPDCRKKRDQEIKNVKKGVVTAVAGIPEVHCAYHPLSLEGKVERLMKESGDPCVGGPGCTCRGFWDAHPGSLERTEFHRYMTRNDRLTRSWIMRHLTPDEIAKVHEWEWTRGFVYDMDFSHIIRRRIKRKKLGNDARKDFEELQDKNRPNYPMEYKGLRVPPFFIYDCTFDPIDYHHRWDMIMKQIEFIANEEDEGIAKKIRHVERRFAGGN